MEQIEQPLEEQQMLGRTKAGADHHAIELSIPQRLFERRLGRLPGIDQAALDLVAQRTHLLDLRVEKGPHELRRQIRHRREIHETRIES